MASSLLNSTRIIAAVIFTMVSLVSCLMPAAGQEPDFQPLSAEKPNAVRVSEATGIKTRGYGKHREMLISGRVFDSSGQPADDFQLQVDVRTSAGRNSLKPAIRGSEYDVWVPTGASDWFYVMFFAESHEGTRIAFEGIAKQSLRHRAIDGFDLMLKRTDRRVEFKVTDDGEPVSGARVTSSWNTGFVRYSTTDSSGTAALNVRREDKLSQLTAWTDDFRLGGYDLSRDPVHDPSLNGYHVELDDCRAETIRFVNADDGTPVPRVSFELIIGTGEPNYNFPGTPETLPQASMTTDENGEADYRWFPDWKKHGAYVEFEDPNWVLADPEPEILPQGNGMLFRLKPRTARKTLRGKVISNGLDVGHLLVEVTSFQGEIDDRSDVKCIFTDEQGDFSVDCLPGATYCVFVNDDTYVSNMIDLIPYEPETGKNNSATLELSEGVPVEVRATVGPSHQLMRKQGISFRVTHDFSWKENGEERHGIGCKDWWLQTNYSGIARTRVLAGSELEVSIYENDWRAKKRVVVKQGEPVHIEIHRAIAGKREVSGQLVLTEGLEANLAGAILEVGSIDGQTKDRQTVKADDRGRFSFETPAIDIGFFAYTTDGKAAAVAKLKRVNEPVTLQLLPTFDQPGRILGNDDQPLAGHPVRATVTVDGGLRWQDIQFSARFTAKTFETRTDKNGHFTLRGLPREASCGVNADAIDDPNQKTSLGSIGVELGETPEPLVGLLSRPAAPRRTLVEK